MSTAIAGECYFTLLRSLPEPAGIMPIAVRSGRLRAAMYEVIFGTETRAGRLFDVALIIAIVASLIAVMLDSIQGFSQRHGPLLHAIEWFFTILFTLEYAARLYCSEHPGRYARSFFGVVDLLSILPTYIALLVPSATFLMVIRTLRILRVFRVLKLVRYVGEANILLRSLRASRRKIFVFLFAVLILATIFGSMLFVAEGGENGFTSIPRSIYWAIITITTVGYGDIAPKTPIGQLIASLVMITGYSIIAVPTGIITAEISQQMFREREVREHACRNCGRRGHDIDALHCKFCGARLIEGLLPSEHPASAAATRSAGSGAP